MLLICGAMKEMNWWVVDWCPEYSFSFSSRKQMLWCSFELSHRDLSHDNQTNVFGKEMRNIYLNYYFGCKK